MSTDDKENKTAPETLANDNSPMESEVDFEELAEKFVEEYRQGLKPSAKEYASRYPEFAEDILDLFPSLLILEKGGESAISNDPDGVGVKGVDPPKLDRLGNFRIIREIGRGGMGVVYEACDEQLDRSVALKVMKIFPGEREQTIRRFQREARIAAKLHHTNIVPVFGSDSVDDLFYYAMQLIDGESLEQYLRLKEKEATQTISSSRKHSQKISNWFRRGRDETKEASEDDKDPAGGTSFPDVKPGVDADKRDPSGFLETELANDKLIQEESELGANDSTVVSNVPHIPLDTSATDLEILASRSMLMSVRIASATYYQRIADLGIQCANALDYAHRHDVIHRDIKPSNLIVDHEGVLWITDFGLARSPNEHVLTQQGQLVGTLRYLAPESLAGDFSPKSDVYSLGLTLYELLTFTPAYRESNYKKLFDQVSAGTPLRPRKINPKIPRDLETIVLKAIDYNPENRYTAREMADDLHRFLDELPIHARRIPIPELIWRWSRRNKLAASLIVTVAVLVGIVLGLMVSAYIKQNSLIAEKKAEAERARQNLTLALDAFDGVYYKLVSNTENGKFNLLDDSDVIYAPVADVALTQQESNALDEMLAFYVKFSQVNRDAEKDLSLRRRSAQAFFRTGLIRARQGEFGFFQAFEQAFLFYKLSLETASSDVEYEEITFELTKLVIEMIVNAPSTLDDEMLSVYVSTALDALSKISTPLSSNRVERMEAQIHYVRGVHYLKRIRHTRDLGSGLFAAMTRPNPTDEEKEVVQRDFDFVQKHVQNIGRPQTIGDLELVANYYTMASLWLSTLNRPEESFSSIRKGLRVARNYLNDNPDCAVAFNAMLRLEYSKMRTIFECQLSDQNEEIRSAAFKKFREIEERITTSQDAKSAEFSSDVTVMLSRIFGCTTLAKLEASQGNLDQVEILLNRATEQMTLFASMRPGFESTPFWLRIHSFYAELFIREDRFEEAEAHVVKLEEIYREWKETNLSMLSNAADGILYNEEDIRHAEEFVRRLGQTVHECRDALEKGRANLIKMNESAS